MINQEISHWENYAQKVIQRYMILQLNKPLHTTIFGNGQIDSPVNLLISLLHKCPVEQIYVINKAFNVSCEERHLFSICDAWQETCSLTSLKSD